MQKIEEIVAELGGIAVLGQIENMALRQRIIRAGNRGALIRVRKGVYMLPEKLATTMIDVEKIIPGGVVCLYSAFRFHGLTTQVPTSTCIAVAHNRKIQLPVFPAISLYYWTDEYLTIGIQSVDIEGMTIRITDLERTVCDAIRYRNKIGLDVCGEVLNDYLKKPNRNIGLLNTYARQLRIHKTLTQYLETRL